MPRNPPIDYTQKYQIRSGRVIFADYVQRRELIQQGKLLGLNLYLPDNQSSIIPVINNGEVNTTTQELERYLGELRETTTNIITGSPPEPPTNLIGTSGDGEVTIVFTPGNDNGSPITNYEYMFPDASGASFEPFSPPTGPVTSLTFTGLENGRTYQIQLRAVNANGASSATSTFFITPVPGGSDLVLFLDGANGGDISEWKDTSGKLKSSTLYNAPSWSSSNSGYYSFNGIDEYGQVPSGFADFTDGITILAFVKFTSSANWGRIIDFGQGEANDNILFGRQFTTNNLTLHIYNGASSTTFDFTNGITNNQWLFAVARLNGSNYLLKNQNTSTTGATAILPTNVERTSNFIGKSNWNGDSLFQGDMGIVAIYDTALSDSQITEFFNLFKTRYFTTPDSPTSVSATAGDASATVSFTAPVNNGGLNIISYTVTSSPGGIMANGSSSPITVSGLTNGTSYTFTVVATNNIGNSFASSASNSVTPVAPSSIEVIILGDAAVTTLSSSIQSARTALGYSSTLNITTQQLNGYTGGNLSSFQVCILYTNGGLNLNATLGNNLNSFVASGGHLIMASFCWGNVSAISSFNYNLYSTYQYKGTYSSVNSSTAVYTIVHPITTGIPTSTGMGSPNIPNPIVLTTAPSSQVIATFADAGNTSFIAVGQNGTARLVGINAYVAGSYSGNFQNTIKYVCNSIYWCMSLI